MDESWISFAMCNKKQNQFYLRYYCYISSQIRKYFEIALKFFYPFPNISKVFPQRNNRYPTLTILARPDDISSRFLAFRPLHYG